MEKVHAWDDMHYLGRDGKPLLLGGLTLEEELRGVPGKMVKAKRKLEWISACKRACPEGNKCCLESKIAHVLCICQLEDCACHEQERYQRERRP